MLNQAQGKEDRKRLPLEAQENWKGAKVDRKIVDMAENPPRANKSSKSEKTH